MKKLLCLLSASFLVLMGCSKDDATSENPDSSTVLLKKIIDTDSDGIETTAEYTYEGNKLIEVSYSDGNIEKSTYTGDLITKVEFFEEEVLIDYGDLARPAAWGCLLSFGFV